VFKVIIAGTRDFADYETLKAYADRKLANITETIEIVSGGARGADALGEQYARERGYQIKRFPADWKQYGRAAGPMRNKAMAMYADALLAYWDGESRGTKNMIELAKEQGLKIGVKIYQRD